MISTVLATLRQTSETNGLIGTFVESINDALSRRFFNFSNCTAAFFFEPGTENFLELFNIVSNVFEQNILRDLINITDLIHTDLKTPPPWAGPDVLPFAGQFLRSAAVHQSAFVNSVDARITSSQPVKRLLEKSHRPHAAVELRSILVAFGSLNLLIKALTTPADLPSSGFIDEFSNHIMSPTVPHVILQLYVNRVQQHFVAEPAPADGLYVRFHGPVNPVAAFVPGQPFYTPVCPAIGSAHAALARLLVAAHRTLCCTPGYTNDILSTTNFVVSFFYMSYDSVWAASRASIPVARAQVRADIAQPPTPRPGAPKTPSGRVVTPTEASRAFRPPSAEAMKNAFLARATSPSKTF